MILARTVFQARPGEAQKVVDYFSDLARMSEFDSQKVIKRSRILTDLSGTFDTVVVESEIESIDDYYAMLQASFADPEMMEQMSRAGVMAYVTGRRDFYKIEGTYEAS